MNLTRRLRLAVFLTSCLIGLLLFEFGYYLVGKDFIQSYKWDRRYMLFKAEDNSTVFKNIHNIFVYNPNTKIESTTYYYVNNNWIREYNYVFPTNNLGLVQTTSTRQQKDSILILGDSYTEGQGAYPWFEGLIKSYETDYQLINGGILGTGFESWKILHDHLIESGIKIKRVVVIFLSDDYSRTVWNMSEKTLFCLKDSKSCEGDENFYGKPAQKDVMAFLEKLRKYREAQLNTQNYINFKNFLKMVLPGTTEIYSFLKGSILPEKTGYEIIKNGKAIESLIEIYSQDVLFIHIPQKDEVLLGRMNKTGKMALNKIMGLHGSVYDGHLKCGFNESDYFKNDGHPNEQGYNKLSKCVRKALETHWPE